MKEEIEEIIVEIRIAALFICWNVWLAATILAYDDRRSLVCLGLCVLCFIGEIVLGMKFHS